MAAAMGWSRTGISIAALLNFLCMGIGSFFWGALSDRFGTRAVVLCGGVLLGLGMVTASQAITLSQFQVLFGVIVGVVAFASTLGMALGPWAGGWLYDAFGSYFWLFIGSCGIGLGAVAIACTFRPPRPLPATLLSPSVAH